MDTPIIPQWLQERYGSERQCMERILLLLYPHLGNYFCPTCKKKVVIYPIRTRPRSYTDGNGHVFSPLTKTIFHRSTTRLPIWFTAMYILENAGPNFSARKLTKLLGVTYKCAWRMK